MRGPCLLRMVERAADDLRRGQPVALKHASGCYGILPIDLMSADARARFFAACQANPVLIITAVRARILNLIPEQSSQPVSKSVALRIDRNTDVGAVLTIADPLEPAQAASPVTLDTDIDADMCASALTMVKIARLLPAALCAPLAQVPAEWLTVEAQHVEDYAHTVVEQLHIVARARVPLAEAEDTEIVAFRANDGALEHLAIVIGDPPKNQPVLARIHSECFTGDLLASLKCDCGSQLRGALSAMREAGHGVLLYLAQEGRGIGLVNKLRAYALQDRGFDTVDANTQLGFEVDERNFASAARMLTLLGFSSIQLMTNNPKKLAALESFGIHVAERVAHQFPSNKHNEQYLETKRIRTGHHLT